MEDRPADEVSPFSAPTGVRWLILTVATLSSVLLYLDRICVSFAVESIRVDFQASQQQMGWFLGAFFWSYALGQVPAGWLGDRFGIRTMLTLYILLWSAFTAFMGLSAGIVTLLAYRFGCGLAQAGAYPSCARAVRDWMPLTQRGMASSIVAFGGRIGGAIAPLLTGAVMIWIALSGRDAQLTADEILDAPAAARFLLAADQDAKPWTTKFRDAVVAIAPRLEVGADDDSATSSDGSAQAIAEILNGIEPLAVLASASDLPALDLPPELQKRIDAYSQSSASMGAADRQLANRQFWEAAIPVAVRKLEARGWRLTLVIYGFAGIVVATLFWIFFRNSPSQHPWCNAAEARLIGEIVTVPTSPGARSRFPWKAIVTDAGLWGNSLCQFATNVGWVFLVTWLPRYLEDVHKVPVLERGLMASVPIFAGMIGMLAGGPWTDRLTARHGLRWGRRMPVVISRLMAIGGYGVCLLVATGIAGPLGTRGPAWLAIAGLAFVAISTDLGVAATWAYAQDIAGKNTAAVLGWANMWGNFGAAVTPMLSARILGEHPTLAEWNLVFVFCAAAFLVSAAGGWLMDASKPLDEG